MTQTPHICLGTVQFGLPYGVTNRAGQVPEDEVSRVLHLAAASGIDLLDTAQAYGTAESVLGRCWPAEAPRRLISKLPAGTPSESWEASLINSLQRLQTPNLDTFLLHRASDLLAADGENLLGWMEGLCVRGLVERIGVSIYESVELEGLPLDRLQVVQLPLSVYDQRLIHDGTVARLKDLGIAVHVRSVLLQGLLLQPPVQWPGHLSPAFRCHHARWLENMHREGLCPLAGALGFLRGCENVEAVLVGVLSSEELAQILEAWSQAAVTPPKETLNWAWWNKTDLDPRCWPPR